MRPPLLFSAVIIDLESTRPDRTSGERRITAIGALRSVDQNTFDWAGPTRDLPAALVRLFEFCRGAEVLVGHNWRRHDRVLLEPFAAAQALLELPVLDTLELSPLAFPRNPYHRLVKGYKLVSESKNDPVSDARLTWQLINEQLEAFRSMDFELLGIYRFLLGRLPGTAYDRLFDALAAPALNQEAATATLLEHFLHPIPSPAPYASGLEEAVPPGTANQSASSHRGCDLTQVCETGLAGRLESLSSDPLRSPALAYALAWLTTVSQSPMSDGNSVVPAWVRFQYPDVASLLRKLRDVPCGPRRCAYCERAHNLERALQDYFGFPGFRSDPVHPITMVAAPGEAASGNGEARFDVLSASPPSLQREITAALAQGTDLIAVLPTGGGKSVCFQLPALLWAARSKRLTLIISPLQSLMKDQVDVLRRRHGIPNAAALYGGLNPLERTTVLEGVAMGDYDLLYVAPEQLRNRSFREVIRQREIAAWIIDEAHCLSKWGHDFRPDYLYIGRFIRETCQELTLPPPTIACFTATAKPEVIDEICRYFHRELDRTLTHFEGSPQRDNLRFLVIEAPQHGKLHHVIELLHQHIRADGGGGTAVVYASSRKATERLARELQSQGWAAEYYHAGRIKEREAIQDQFIRGELPVIVATNAFGMGVDKENVRLVIHADIPGSLEAYLQEAGRAGRDRKPAMCVLLYDPRDVDTQFRLQGSNRIALPDIQALLKGIRSRAKRMKANGEIVVTSGELLQEDIETDIDLHDRQYDTKVKTAILVLEQADLVRRDENRYAVFEGKLRFKHLFEIDSRLKLLNLPEAHLERCRNVCKVLLDSPDDQAYNTDVMADQCGMSPEDLMRVLRTLREAQLSTLSLQLTAEVSYGVQGDSLSRLEALSKLERTLIQALQEDIQVPADAGAGSELELNLRALSHQLKQRGLEVAPAEVRPLLFALRQDGAWKLARRGADRYAVELKMTLAELKTLSSNRLAVARVLLDRLLEQPREKDQRGGQVLSFTLSDLEQALSADMFTRLLGDLEERAKAALLFLHDQRVIILQAGLTVLRPAMTLSIKGGGRATKAHFKPLEDLYRSQVVHIHVMDRYAQLGATRMERALELVADYFRLDEEAFLARHFAGERQAVSRPTSARMYHTIVESLGDRIQQAIVTSNARAMLVLAGPGSGKTRIVVHRVAYLLEVERVPAEHLLVLTFNRGAAREVRRRLVDLLGNAGYLVSVYTYHSLALSLIGLDLSAPGEEDRFKADDEKERQKRWNGIIDQACDVLEGRAGTVGTTPDADEWRSRVVGWRYIFVDEYQDVNAAQYRLIRALTGQHLADEEERLTLMAVGDDDQSIYAFNGARIEYLQRFEADYRAERQHLVVNFRSTAPIVQASSALIGLNRERMKAGLELRAGRKPDAASDPSRLRAPVVVRRARDSVEATRATVDLLKEVASQTNEALSWSDFAVLARHNRQLQALEVLLQREGIPVRRLARERLPFHRLRPVSRLLDVLQRSPGRLLTGEELRAHVFELYGGEPLDDIGIELLEMVVDWEAEVGGRPATARSFVESVYDRQRDPRQGERGRLVLATLHSAKGLEFDGVVLLAAPPDHGMRHIEAVEEERRLFYVGMTRAKNRLWLVDERSRPSPFVREALQHSASKAIQVNDSAVVLQARDGDIEGLAVAELGLEDLWTSFPARGARGLPGERIAGLRPGDRLELVPTRGKDGAAGLAIRVDRVNIGMLSQKGVQRFLQEDGTWKVAVMDTTVSAIAVMDRKAAGNEPVDRWEIVIPRVVYRQQMN